MTLDEIKELLRIFKESGVGEMEMQRGEDRVRFRRTETAGDEIVGPTLPPVKALVPKAPETEVAHVLVRSPIVGTFYDAPSPGAAPFVSPGDSIEPGQVLCIIESMKLMNEIEAEVAGVVAAKLVENGRPVEYGEALFSIRPR